MMLNTISCSKYNTARCLLKTMEGGFDCGGIINFNKDAGFGFYFVGGDKSRLKTCEVVVGLNYEHGQKCLLIKILNALEDRK